MLGHDVVISTSVPHLRKQIAAIGNDCNNSMPVHSVSVTESFTN